MRLISVGNVIVDLLLRVPSLPQPGGDVVATEAGYQLGGSFNVLVTAQRHGLAALYAGAHGSGPFGDRVRAGLAEAGIGVQHDPTPGLDTGFDVAVTQADGERSFLTAFGAEAELTASQLASVRPEPGDFVHVSGYGLLQRTNAAVIADWLPGVSADAVVLLDPGPLLADVEPATWLRIGERVDWLSLNVREAAVLTGEADPGTAAARLARRFPQVIVRDGANGAWLAGAGSVRLVPTLTVTAVDTNGAGDAHCGSLLAALARGEAAESAVRIANACAAISTTRFGPATAPDLAETLAALG